MDSSWISNRKKLTSMHFVSSLRIALRILLGIIFLWSGFIKLYRVQDFADSVATFRILPSGLIDLFALGLPPFEIMIGVMLLCGWKSRAAALGALLILSCFIVALFQGLVRGLSIDCGCFGSGVSSVWRTWEDLGRDLLLLGMSVWVYCQCDLGKKLHDGGPK